MELETGSLEGSLHLLGDLNRSPRISEPATSNLRTAEHLWSQALQSPPANEGLAKGVSSSCLAGTLRLAILGHKEQRGMAAFRSCYLEPEILTRQPHFQECRSSILTPDHFLPQSCPGEAPEDVKRALGVVCVFHSRSC